jgi:hypothetical protein
MYRVQNNRQLTRHLLVKAGNGSIAIVDLEGAAGFIETHGKTTIHWQTAGVAVENADRDGSLIGHATDSFENALATDDMLVKPRWSAGRVGMPFCSGVRREIHRMRCVSVSALLRERRGCLFTIDCAGRCRPDVYLVLNQFGGRLGRAWSETNEEDTDYGTLIRHLLEGQYSNPVRVVAFNTAEGWSRDVSNDVADELRERCAGRGEVPACSPNF